MVHGSSTLNVPALLMAALVFTPMLAGSRVGYKPDCRAVPGAAGGLAGRPEPRRDVKWARNFPPSNRRYSRLLLLRSLTGRTNLPGETCFQTGLKAWARASLRYFFRLAPVMVLAGFVSALVIQWVSPETVSQYLGNNLQGVAIAATLGVLINVPLMFEIPLVAALLLVGMGEAPAATPASSPLPPVARLLSGAWFGLCPSGPWLPWRRRLGGWE